MEAFVKYIRKNRVKIEVLSKKLGFSVGAIHSWKTGKAKPSLTSAIKLDRYTNGEVSVYDWE